LNTILSEKIIYLKPDEIETFKPEYPAIYSGLPNEKYHSFKESESSTTVKELLITIKHWIDRENKSTDAMAFGTLFHDAMEALRTGKDLTEFSRVIDSFGRTKKSDAADFILKYYPLVHQKEYPEAIEDMTSKNTSRSDLHDVANDLERIFLDGKQKVTTEDFERSQAMVEAISGNPVTKRLIGYSGHAELSFFCEIDIEIEGVLVPVKVRVRPDDLIEFEDEIWILDWKSIGEYATNKNIKKSSWRWRYDIQAAMYQHVIAQFTDKPVQFRLVFAESIKPAKEKVRVIGLPDHDMESGWNDYMSALVNKAKWIQDQSVWSGYDIPDDGVDIIPMRNLPY